MAETKRSKPLSNQTQMLEALASGPKTLDEARQGRANRMPTLITSGFARSVGDGIYEITDAGREALDRDRLSREASDVAREIRDQTVGVCIKAVESLLLNSQGLTLDAGTIYACANILRSLKAPPSPPEGEANG